MRFKRPFRPRLTARGCPRIIVGVECTRRMRAGVSLQSRMSSLNACGLDETGGFFFVSALIMTTEGASTPAVPESVGGSLPVANLKALLKDSLSEILRENPSLLQPPGETQRGELASFGGRGQRGLIGYVLESCRRPNGVAARCGGRSGRP